MAAYFPTLRRQPRLDAVQEEATRPSIGPLTAEEDARWLANTSILIFPSPSTSMPQTPASSNAPIPASPASGSMSNYSIPTSISIESNLESASEQGTPSLPRHIRLRRKAGPQTSRDGRNESPVSPGANEAQDRWRTLVSKKFEVDLESASETTGSLDPEVEVWEWSSFPASSNEAFPRMHQPDSDESNRTGIELWASHLRTRTTSQWTQATDTSRLTYFSHSVPEKERIITQPPVHFPFLSAILKLLNIDPETVLLLGVFGSSSTEGELFLSSPYDHNDTSIQCHEEETPTKRDPVIAMLRGSTESTPSTSSHSIKQGILAASEHPHPSGLMLTFPSNLPFSIHDVILSPITLSKAVASGTVDLTAGAFNYSSGAVGSVLGAVGRPIWSIAKGGLWGRSEPVTS